MKKTLELRQPILVDNKEIKTLDYDVSLIDSEAFCDAFSYSASKNASGQAKAALAETDASLHLYLGFMAIKACNPNLDISDLERIKGMDIMEVVVIGRNFTCMTAEESLPSDSEKQSEDTVESTTQVSKSSK